MLYRLVEHGEAEQVMREREGVGGRGSGLREGR